MIRLFKISIPSSVAALAISEAILIFSCYVLATYLVADASVSIFLLEDGGWWHIALVAGVIVLGLYFHNLYGNYRVRSRILLIQQFCLSLGVAFLLQALMSYGGSDAVLAKWQMVWGSLFVLLVLPAWRLLFTHLVSKAVGARRLLFVGASPIAREIIAALKERPELGLAAVGYVETSSANRHGLHAGSSLDETEEISKLVADHHADGIVLGGGQKGQRLPVDYLLSLRSAGIELEEASTTYEAVFGRISTRVLDPAQLVFSDELRARPGNVTLQSVYSWTIAMAAAIVTLPVMAIVAVILKVTSPGPIFCREKRVGLDGVDFTLLTFRSRDADTEQVPDSSAGDRRGRPPAFARWLRRSYLNDLPMLLNVIRGDMSIIGPRPQKPEFVNALGEKIPFYPHRHSVKPGITGWAQINQKDGGAFEDSITELEYDLYYINNLALSLDVYILLHSFKILVFGKESQ